MNSEEPQESEYVCDVMTEDRLEEGSEMMSRAFIKNNSIWVKLGVTYEEAKEYNTYRLKKGIDSKLTFVRII